MFFNQKSTMQAIISSAEETAKGTIKKVKSAGETRETLTKPDWKKKEIEK